MCKYFYIGFLAMLLSLSVNAQIKLKIDKSAGSELSLSGKFASWQSIVFAQNLSLKDKKEVIISSDDNEDELFLLNDIPVYLESGTSIKLLYRKKNANESDVYQAKRSYTLDFVDESIESRQNILLRNLERHHYTLVKYKEDLSTHSRKLKKGEVAIAPTLVSSKKLEIETKGLIKEFVKNNKDASKKFITFIKLHNQCFFEYQKFNYDEIKGTYYSFSKEQLSILEKTRKCSENDCAVLSSWYRLLLNYYVDYLRIKDTEKRMVADGSLFIANEINLASYFQSEEVKEYIIKKNMTHVRFPRLSDKEKERQLKVIPTHWQEYLRQNEAKFARLKGGKGRTKAPHIPNIIGETPDGKFVDIKEYRGQWVLIDVWGTHCVPCHREFPFLKELKKSLKNKNVIILGITIDTQRHKEKWRKMIKDRQIGGLQLILDYKECDVYKQLGLGGIPHFALINPKGELVYNGFPLVSTGIMDKVLTTIIEDK